MSAPAEIMLQRRDPVLNIARFYTVRIEPTLFGQWAVVREWGRLGAGGCSRETWFADLGAALAEQVAWERRKRSRGISQLRLNPASSVLCAT